MTIAFDATAGDTLGVNVTTISHTHTCTGSNLVLLAGITSNNSANTISSVKYNNISMTLATSHVDNGQVQFLYYLINPSTGSNTLTVTFDQSVGGNGARLISASYTGVKQDAGGINNTSTATAASGSTFSESITPSVDNCWAVALIYNANGDSITVTSTGDVARASNNVFDKFCDSNNTVTANVSHTFSFSATTSTGPWNGITLALAPPPAKVVKPLNLLLGIGQ